MISASYRLYDSNAPDERTRVEVVCGVVTEYGTRANDGGFNVWPPDNPEYPTAKRIGHALRNGQTVIRRRVVAIEDWTEVDAP